MSARGPFRPEARDQLDAVERLDERIRIVPARARALAAVQGVLLALLLAWGIFGRLPVNAEGEAVWLGAPGADAALVALDGVAPGAAVPLGARAVLQRRDDPRVRLTGRVIALPPGVDDVAGAPAAARAWSKGSGGGGPAPGPARLAVRLDPAAAGASPPLPPLPEPGTRCDAVVTLREEAPLRWALEELRR